MNNGYSELIEIVYVEDRQPFGLVIQGYQVRIYMTPIKSNRINKYYKDNMCCMI